MNVHMEFSAGGKRERQGTADDMREAEGARGKSTGQCPLLAQSGASFPNYPPRNDIFYRSRCSRRYARRPLGSSPVYRARIRFAATKGIQRLAENRQR